ncbi:MAG TPA: crotonase/enoyl-CoA hydratase family protein [Mycobacteriales bacterium]|nr:crotonase/enoyl-CoA hydratase family protein [Mycobacteriales bacterium]
MPDYDEIRYDADDRIATITLHRPDKLNAFTPIMKREMLDALGHADSDDDVRVVIVTGSGRAFCAGADLSAGGDTFDYKRRGGTAAEAPRDGGGEVSLRVFEMRKPVIAAINGSAVGVGITMTLPMDIRLVADTAKLGFVFARRGVVPEAASSWFLPRIVGPSQAAEWLFTGRVFDAAEALAGGLVRSVHPAGDVLAVARELAREIADNAAPVSVALARRMMWRGLAFASPYDSHVVDSRAMHQTGQAADVREGIAAFLEKRAPEFPGRVSIDLPEVFADPQPSWAETVRQ